MHTFKYQAQQLAKIMNSYKDKEELITKSFTEEQFKEYSKDKSVKSLNEMRDYIREAIDKSEKDNSILKSTEDELSNYERVLVVKSNGDVDSMYLTK